MPRAYGSSIVAFAALIAGSLVFLLVSSGTALHQLAIGIMLASLTLAITLALLEMCWNLALHVAGSGKRY
jgi:hypothetical protein